MLLPFLLRAQMDTVYHLQEVKILGLPLSRYTPGSKVQHVQRTGESTTLTDLLGNESPLYFKTYGNGQLATVSFRGTSASHTAVLWNGINVNSPTLGQTDFSIWPSFLLDEVAVQYGAASALYGTDALGGSVLLNQSTPDFARRKFFEYRSEAGSFGHMLNGFKAGFGNEHLQFKTKIFYRKITNDFPYTSPKVGFEKRQAHAFVENYGFDQQVHWKISEKQRFSAEAMYQHNFREIQPTVTSDYSNEVIKDENARVALNYTHDLQAGSLFVTLGYILNDQLYNRQSKTRSDQITTLIQFDRDLGKKTSFRIGTNWTKYYALSDGFVARIAEDRFDSFLSFRHRATSFWLMSLNLRQSVYANRYAPFAPSWGNEFTLNGQKQLQVKIRTQLARAYRVPTLNDRYWVPGGNSHLKPENGFNAEAGVDILYRKGAHELKLEITHHRLWTDQWIIWLPNQSGLWTPSNLSKVNVQGVEAGVKYNYDRPKWKLRTGIMYAFTRSINQKGLSATDATGVNKQLPYTPVHSGNIFCRAEFGSWSAEIQERYTGLRFTTLDNERYQSLKPYGLLSASLSKRFVLPWVEVATRFTLNNLLNVYYENIENRAMPGRNFMLTLQLKF